MTDKALAVEVDDDCIVHSFSEDAKEMAVGRCTLRLSPNFIRVEYIDELGEVIYVGKAVGDGHFDLICKERNGAATLHRAPNDLATYEGFWNEDGSRGMWRIMRSDL